MAPNPDKKASKKGGISKQVRRRLHAQGRVIPRLTHAGLAPQMYTALHDIVRPTVRPLTIHGRELLQRNLRHLRSRIDDLKKSLTSTQDLLEIFSEHEHDEGIRESLCKIMDSLSSSLADLQQRLVGLEADELADNYQLSLQLAYELQELEVRSHDQWIGRLDQPRDANPEPLRRPRVLKIRSDNVPSPIPTRRLRQTNLDAFIIGHGSGLNNAAVVTPDDANLQKEAVVEKEIGRASCRERV